MAFVLRNGLGTQVIADEFDTVNGTPSVNTTNPRTGSACVEASGNITAGNVESVGHTYGNLTNGYYQVAFRINQLTTTDGVGYIQLLDSTQTNFAFVFQVTYNGATYDATCFVNDFGDQITLSGVTISTNTQHVLEFHYNSSNAGATDVVEVWLDDVLIGSSSTLTLATTPAFLETGIFNAGAGTISTSTMLFDDYAINNTSGSTNTGRVGLERLYWAVPTGAGDNAPTAGNAASVSEVPWTDTASSSANRIELDTNTTIADFVMTTFPTLGIDSYDTVTGVSVMVRLREDTSAATGYNLRAKSVSAGTVSSSSTLDAGNTTVRTNPSGTTNFGRYHFVETDPTSGSAWSSTNATWQAGIASTTNNDIWATAFGAYVCARDGTPPAAGGLVGIIGTGVVPF